MGKREHSPQRHAPIQHIKVKKSRIGTTWDINGCMDDIITHQLHIIIERRWVQNKCHCYTTQMSLLYHTR